MKNTAIGGVIGLVLGVAVGASVVGPNLNGDKGARPQAHPRPLNQINVGQTSAEKTNAGQTETKTTKEKPNTLRMATLSATKTATAPALAPAKVTPAPAAISSKIRSNPPLTVSLRLENAFPLSNRDATTQALRAIGEIQRLGQGTIAITPFGPDAIVPPKDLLNAVVSGTVDAAFSAPHLWADRVPAFGLLSAVPFGPGPAEHINWFFNSDAHTIYDAAHAELGVKGVICGVSAPGAGAWFDEEITTPEQLRDMRVRLSGRGGRILKRLGVVPVEMAAHEALSALEAGELDGAVFSRPEADLALGAQRAARNYYFPAWDRPAHLYELIINLKKWRALGPGGQARVKAACGDNVRFGLTTSLVTPEVEALMQLSAEGVQVHRWPDSVMKTIAKAWHNERAESLKNDKAAQALWRSLVNFRENYAIWQELADTGPPEAD